MLRILAYSASFVALFFLFEKSVQKHRCVKVIWTNLHTIFSNFLELCSELFQTD